MKYLITYESNQCVNLMKIYIKQFGTTVPRDLNSTSRFKSQSMLLWSSRHRHESHLSEFRCALVISLYFFQFGLFCYAWAGILTCRNGNVIGKEDAVNLYWTRVSGLAGAVGDEQFGGSVVGWFVCEMRNTMSALSRGWEEFSSRLTTCKILVLNISKKAFKFYFHCSKSQNVSAILYTPLIKLKRLRFYQRGNENAACINF